MTDHPHWKALQTVAAAAAAVTITVAVLALAAAVLQPAHAAEVSWASHGADNSGAPAPGSLGEGTPDPDAIGVLSAVSEAGIAQRTSVLYGFAGSAGVMPLALDLRGEDRIRINFAYNSAQLNFNILLYDGITPYTQIGLNILANPGPFSVDFAFADGVYPSGRSTSRTST
jgi:hypothetical protein